MKHTLCDFDKVLLSYESRKFEIVSRGWIPTPTGQVIDAGTTQRMSDCGDYEFIRIYTGLWHVDGAEYVLLRRKKV